MRCAPRHASQSMWLRTRRRRCRTQSPGRSTGLRGELQMTQTHVRCRPTRQHPHRPRPRCDGLPAAMTRPCRRLPQPAPRWPGGARWHPSRRWRARPPARLCQRPGLGRRRLGYPRHARPLPPRQWTRARALCCPRHVPPAGQEARCPSAPHSQRRAQRSQLSTRSAREGSPRPPWPPSPAQSWLARDAPAASAPPRRRAGGAATGAGRRS